MATTEQRFLDVNGIQLSVHIAGPEKGRPIWLLHGFPECWYSWRHQIEMLADQGYRVHAPEMRGYGRTSAPEATEDYDILMLCADIQGAMDLLGQKQVAMVGHDWGALVAWHLALLEPVRITTLCCMSVPYAGRPKVPPIHKMRELFADRFHYIVYFQEVGPAERELEADIARTLRLVMHGLSSNTAAGEGLIQNKPAGSGWLEGLSYLLLLGVAMPIKYVWASRQPGVPQKPSQSMRRATSAAAFMAHSTGIATSNATGSALRIWRARQSISRRCSL